MPLSIFTIFFIHSILMDTSCFHLLVCKPTAIMWDAAIFFPLVVILPNKYPSSAGSYGSAHFNLYGFPPCMCQCTFLCSAPGFFALSPQLLIICFRLLCNRCDVVSHSFWFCIYTDDWVLLTLFFMYCCVCISLGKCPFMFLSPFLNWTVILLLSSVSSSIFWILTPLSDNMICKIFTSIPEAAYLFYAGSSFLIF